MFPFHVERLRMGGTQTFRGGGSGVRVQAFLAAIGACNGNYFRPYLSLRAWPRSAASL